MAKTKFDSRPLVPGEFIIEERSEAFCRESSVIKNDATEAGTGDDIANIDDITGQPVKKSGNDWLFASAASVAGGDVDGFLVDGDPIVDMAGDTFTDWQYPILARGPAILNKGRIPATDVYGSAINAALYVTAAEALNMVVRPLPPKTSEQTT
jgi:hypothetical protein